MALMGGQPLPVYGIPAPEKGAKDRLAREYHREVDYDQDELAIQSEELQNSLTNNQRQVYSSFIEMVEQTTTPTTTTLCSSTLQAVPARPI